MKISMTSSERKRSLFGSAKFIDFKFTALFTDEELAVIKANDLGVVAVDPINETVFAKSHNYQYTIANIVKTAPTGFTVVCDNQLEANNVREGMKQFLANLKATIDSFGSRENDEAFEL